MTDNELINKIQSGSIDDYTLIIERYQGKLQSALSFYCQNSRDVQYFLHETFVMAYSKLNKFNKSYPFYPWLKTIAVNLLREEIRKRKSLSERAAKYMETQLDLESSSTVRDSKLDALQGCMNELDDTQKELMKKRYWAKESISFLAEKMQRKPSALKMQVLRIRESLKKCIKVKLEVESGTV